MARGKVICTVGIFSISAPIRSIRKVNLTNDDSNIDQTSHLPGGELCHFINANRNVENITRLSLGQDFASSDKLSARAIHWREWSQRTETS
jgi:hypothetical protein